MKKIFEIGLIALVVVAMGIPVMAGWGDGQIVFGNNGQKIDANTAGEISIVDDTDAVTLLTFGLKSEKTFSDMDDNDQIVINLVEAQNSGDESIIYATMVPVITDVTDGTEDATVATRIMKAGTLTTVTTVDSTGLVVVGILSATTLDVDSLTVDEDGLGIDTQAGGKLNIGITTADAIDIGKTTEIITLLGPVNADEAVTMDTSLAVGTTASIGGDLTLNSNIVVVSEYPSALVLTMADARDDGTVTNLAQFLLNSTDQANAVVGAVSDIAGFRAMNDASNSAAYGWFRGTILDVSDGVERGQLDAIVQSDGTATSYLTISDAGISTPGACDVAGASTAGSYTSDANVDSTSYMTIGTTLGLTKSTIAATEAFVITNVSAYVSLTTTGAVTSSVETAIADGSAANNYLVIENSGAADVVLKDSANTKFSGDMTLTGGSNDTIVLIWNGADWLSLGLTDN